MLDVGREVGVPESSWVSGHEEYTAHTQLSCIDGANHQQVVQDHSGQVGRSLGDVLLGQGFKVIEAGGPGGVG